MSIRKYCILQIIMHNKPLVQSTFVRLDRTFWTVLTLSMALASALVKMDRLVFLCCTRCCANSRQVSQICFSLQERRIWKESIDDARAGYSSDARVEVSFKRELI